MAGVPVFVTNIKGDPGYNATGAAEDDAAIAAFALEGSGPTETGAAINTRIAGQKRALFHDFSLDPDGAIQPFLQSGQAATVTGSAPAYVDDGALTHNGLTSGNVSYFLSQTTNPLRMIGVEFELQAVISGSGILAFGNWTAPFNVPIPTANIHFIITNTGWSYGIYRGSGGGGDDVRAAFLFDTALPLHVKLRCEIALDLELGEAYVLLPDGTTHTIKDTRITTFSGNHPFWEHLAGSQPEVPVLVHRIWADDVAEAGRLAPGMAEVVKAAAKAGPRTLVHSDHAIASGTVPLTLAGTFYTVMSMSIVVPESGKLLLEGQIFTAMTGSTTIYAIVLVGGSGTYGFAQEIFTGNMNGLKPIMGVCDVSAFIPGSVQTLTVTLGASNAASVTYINNAVANRLSTIKVTDIPASSV